MRGFSSEGDVFRDSACSVEALLGAYCFAHATLGYPGEHASDQRPVLVSNIYLKRDVWRLLQRSMRGLKLALYSPKRASRHPNWKAMIAPLLTGPLMNL